MASHLGHHSSATPNNGKLAINSLIYHVTSVHWISDEDFIKQSEKALTIKNKNSSNTMDLNDIDHVFDETQLAIIENCHESDCFVHWNRITILYVINDYS